MTDGCRKIGLLVLALALAHGGAPSASDPAPTPPDHPQGREVRVTDAHCGVEGALREDHRRCALECSANGSPLVLYDPEREALYTVVWSSEELRIRVLNDFAGLPGVAIGIWDDEARTVDLRDMSGIRVERELGEDPSLGASEDDGP